MNEMFGLSFILITTLSLTATFLSVIIILTLMSILIWRKVHKRHDQSTENSKATNVAAYEEIELHQFSSTINTKENVAYSHNKSLFVSN